MDRGVPNVTAVGPRRRSAADVRMEAVGGLLVDPLAARQHCVPVGGAHLLSENGRHELTCGLNALLRPAFFTAGDPFDPAANYPNPPVTNDDGSGSPEDPVATRAYSRLVVLKGSMSADAGQIGHWSVLDEDGSSPHAVY